MKKSTENYKLKVKKRNKPTNTSIHLFDIKEGQVFRFVGEEDIFLYMRLYADRYVALNGLDVGQVATIYSGTTKAYLVDATVIINN